MPAKCTSGFHFYEQISFFIRVIWDYLPLTKKIIPIIKTSSMIIRPPLNWNKINISPETEEWDLYLKMCYSSSLDPWTLGRKLRLRTKIRFVPNILTDSQFLDEYLVSKCMVDRAGGALSPETLLWGTVPTLWHSCSSTENQTTNMHSAARRWHHALPGKGLLRGRGLMGKPRWEPFPQDNVSRETGDKETRLS